MPKFEPLRLELVEEGAFLEAINKCLAEIQAEHIRHVKQYGQEAAKKSMSQIKMALQLRFEGRDENDFSVKGTIRKEVPARPPAVTTAISDEEQDGTPSLFVRRTGSTKDSPKQGILATKKGRVVDPDTGEIKE